jgi:hypothetical protein
MVGAAVVGVAVREHVIRRDVEQRYQDAVTARQVLERRVEDIITNHERVKGDLRTEQDKSRQLGEALAAAEKMLQEASNRIEEEQQNARKLQVRLSAMQQQMEQLQGELSVALQERPGAAEAKSGGPVQLERIVVSDERTASSRGRVVSVHGQWNFVVVDLGWDAVKIGDTLAIFRNEQLTAKARIDRVQEGVCAATILPGWTTDSIRVNDVAKAL